VETVKNTHHIVVLTVIALGGRLRKRHAVRDPAFNSALLRRGNGGSVLVKPKKA
jgi:hypothetical protein